MSKIEILSLIITLICVASFATVFTVLFRHYYKGMISDVKDGKLDIELIDNALYEEKIEKSKKHKVFKIVLKTFSSVLLGVILLGFGVSLYSRITGNLMPIGNNTFVVVSTGSMEKRNENNDYLDTYNLRNQINTYDMVNITKIKNKEEIKLYDVIAFKADDGRVIVHRVVKITSDGLITKGDSNRDNDVGSLYSNYLSYKNVIGKYTGTRIPLVGLFVIFLQSNAGIITIVSVFYCLLMFEHLKGKYENAIIERTNFLIDLINVDLEEDDISNLESSYQEILIYKGQEYRFVSGKFIEKKESTTNYKDDEMVFIKDKDNSVKIKNTKEKLDLDSKEVE